MSRNIANLPYNQVLSLTRNKIAKLYEGELDDVLEDTEYYDSLLRLVVADIMSDSKISSKFTRDISKIQFDLENNDVMGTIKIGEATLEICWGGGDWEYPIIFAIYYDGNDIRGYVPEKGNVYNKVEKAALGNNDDDNDDLEFDHELRNHPLIIEAVKKRLKII